MSDSDLGIVVLISGNGSNLQAIIDQLHLSPAPVCIKAVISNQENAYGLVRAKNAGIPTHIVKHQRFPDREQFDREITAIIDSYQPQLVVLAGFMRILSGNFVQHYHDRLINIHPSLLPEFRGLKTHSRVLQAGVREHGASVHFVTEDLDSGPVVLQAHINVRPDDSEESLAQRVLELEHIIYPLVILWYAQARLRFEQGKLFFDNKVVTQALEEK